MAKQPRLVQSLLSHVIVDIACGTGHNLALTESKQMYSWGTGCQGELGIGAENLGNFSDAQPVCFSGNVNEIAAGVVHSCAITAEKRLLVWGNNRQAQLGFDKKLREAYRPILFGGLLEAKRISPGLDTTAMQDKVIHDFGLDINYLNVKCGSAMTVA